MRRTLWLASLLILVCSSGLSQETKKGSAKKPAKESAAKMPAHQIFTPSDIKWVDAPAILPKGAKMAVLEGNPSKPGYFAMRLKTPNGYRIMPHWHPNVERVTVISGTAYIGDGDTFDEKKGHAMPAGTYSTMRPKVHHFFWAKGETDLEITTLGPWKLVYINPADDPSKKQ